MPRNARIPQFPHTHTHKKSQTFSPPQGKEGEKIEEKKKEKTLLI